MQNKTLFGLPLHAIEKIRAVFRDYPEIKQVLLYGSRAMGTYRMGSDIDLCIEGEDVNYTQLLEIENKLDDLLLPWKIDLSLRCKIENLNLIDHIHAIGIVFYP